jgi:hypothetical protein
MRKLDIRSVIRKKRRFFGKQASVVHPNRLDRQFHTQAPLRKLVTDITYIRVGDRFVYLSAILHLFNNEIVAWHLSEHNDLALVTNTVDLLGQKADLSGVLLHSDQGFQYTSKHSTISSQSSGWLEVIPDVGTVLTMLALNHSFHILRQKSFILPIHKRSLSWRKPFVTMLRSTTMIVFRKG